jgi:6,7-dimethyl-8-ribityllumazine synthase
MVKKIQGKLDGRGFRFAIVVARFNEHVSSKLLGGALDMLERHNTDPDDITVAWVPGSFEIPLVAERLAASGDYDALICLGAIIRGATPHFDFVAAQAARGVAQTALETRTPCLFGVLTCDTIEQAVERAGSKAGNKGAHAAMGALEMAAVMKQL